MWAQLLSFFPRIRPRKVRIPRQFPPRAFSSKSKTARFLGTLCRSGRVRKAREYSEYTTGAVNATQQKGTLITHPKFANLHGKFFRNVVTKIRPRKSFFDGVNFFPSPGARFSPSLFFDRAFTSDPKNRRAFFQFCNFIHFNWKKIFSGNYGRVFTAMHRFYCLIYLIMKFLW